MVFSNDVAQLLVSIVNEQNKDVEDQVFNIAFKEEVTLRYLLGRIASCLGVQNVKYNYDDETAWFRYPTAERGAISIEKATENLNWQPTALDSAIIHTCKFFEEAMVNPTFSKDREIMLATFIEDALPDQFTDDEQFVAALRKAYGPRVFEGVDLGFDIDPDENRIGYDREDL